QERAGHCGRDGPEDGAVLAACLGLGVKGFVLAGSAGKEQQDTGASAGVGAGAGVVGRVRLGGEQRRQAQSQGAKAADPKEVAATERGQRSEAGAAARGGMVLHEMVPPSSGTSVAVGPVGWLGGAGRWRLVGWPWIGGRLDPCSRIAERPGPAKASARWRP